MSGEEIPSGWIPLGNTDEGTSESLSYDTATGEWIHKHSEVRRFLSDRLDADQVAAAEGLDRRPRFLRLRVFLRRLRWGLR